MKAFKSINLFRLSADHGLTAESISEALAKRPFTRCRAGDMMTMGFVAPAPHCPDLITYVNQGAVLVHLKTEAKIIPSAVKEQETQKRIAAIEESEGRKVGRKEAKDIKESVADTLKLTAFTKITMQRAIIDLQQGLVMIEASSTGRAEDMLCVMREAIGVLNTKLVSTNKSPVELMTEWVDADEDHPIKNSGYAFGLGTSCELKCEEDGGAIARCSNQELDSDEINEHIRNGKRATKLALEWSDKISFQLTESLEIKRIKMMDILQDQLKGADVATQDAMFESSATLFIGEMRQFIPALIDALSGEVA